MNYVNLYNLKPGDRIVVPKSWMKVIQHHVIYLGQNYLGEHLIAENAVGLYVRIVTATEFFRDNPEVTGIEPFVGDNIQRRLAVERALNRLGQPYALINYNCEHFASDVQTGNPRSNQVGWGIFAIAVIALVAFSD